MFTHRSMLVLPPLMIVGAWLAPALAHADPCTAPLPAAVGARFAGVVRFVIDGDGFCVGESADPATWIEVRTAGFDAPELTTRAGRADKRIAEAIAAGRRAQCISVVGRNGRVGNYDRVFARCTFLGRAFGDLMRAAHAREGGR